MPLRIELAESNGENFSIPSCIEKQLELAKIDLRCRRDHTMTKDGTNVDATSKSSKFIEIVLDAIAKLGEKYGSSAKNILNYVRSNSKTINRNLTVQVQQALRRGVIGGQIKLCGSRYRLHCKRELKPPCKSEISEPKPPPSSPKSLRIKPKPLPTEPKSPVKEPPSNPKVSTKKTELPTSKLKIPKPEPPKTRSSSKKSESSDSKKITKTKVKDTRKEKQNKKDKDIDEEKQKEKKKKREEVNEKKEEPTTTRTLRSRKKLDEPVKNVSSPQAKDSNNKKTATSTSHSSKRKGKKNPPACK